MKISTQTSFLFSKLGEDEALKVFAEAGYDCLDYSMFFMNSDPNCVWFRDGWREHAKELRKKCESYGMSFNQSHAPFNYQFKTEGVFENKFMPETIQSLEISGLLGVKNVIVHPVHYTVYEGHEEEFFERNIEFYRRLIPAAEKFGVNVSVENMWQNDQIRKYPIDDVCASPDEFCRYIDTLRSYSPVFNACLDIGHVVLVRRDIPQMIRRLGADRLKALHIHDNNFISDQHTLPGLGKINFRAFMDALYEIGYTGEFTYEADRFIAGFDVGFLPAGVKYMVDLAKFWTKR